MIFNQLINGAYQDENYIYIPIPLFYSRAESIFIYILLQAISRFQGYLQDEKGNLITDKNDNPIEFDNSRGIIPFKAFLWAKFYEENYQIHEIIIEYWEPYENQQLL